MRAVYGLGFAYQSYTHCRPLEVPDPSVVQKKLHSLARAGGRAAILPVNQDNTMLIFIRVVSAGINREIFPADGNIDMPAIGM